MNLKDTLKTLPPLPWHAEHSPADYAYALVGNRAENVLETLYGDETPEEQYQAVTAYVLHACNNLPEVVRRLEQLHRAFIEDAKLSVDPRLFAHRLLIQDTLALLNTVKPAL